jgi:Family of unknown function (DUF5941)
VTLPLVEYRDDGPIATSVRRVGTVRVESLTLTVLGVLAGTVGLLLDGAVTGPASYAGIGLFVVLATLGAAARRGVRVQWLVPPLLRIGEYMTVAVLASRVDATTAAAAFVLLAVVAFHHYDIVYRLRHQHTTPSHLVSQLCGGWEVRTIVVVLAAATGTLLPTLLALAAWCGVLYVTESLRSWARLALDGTAVARAGAEIEEDAG